MLLVIVFECLLCFPLERRLKIIVEEINLQRVGNCIMSFFSILSPPQLIAYGHNLKFDRSGHENGMQNKAFYMSLQMNFIFINYSWFLHSQKLQRGMP